MPNSPEPNKCFHCAQIDWTTTKPMPVPGRTDVDEIKLGTTSYFAVVCPGCGVRGPAAYNVNDAIIKWNDFNDHLIGLKKT